MSIHSEPVSVILSESEESGFTLKGLRLEGRSDFGCRSSGRQIHRFAEIIPLRLRSGLRPSLLGLGSPADSAQDDRKEAATRARPAMQQANIFSVDVEDWFHILELSEMPDVQQWRALPSHVEKNFRKLLDLFSRYQVKVTCFFLGWVAQQFPELVREAAAGGHEIASHGYSHMLCSEMPPEVFFKDVCRAKAIIEDILGSPIQGYRAPGFSVTAKTPWFFEKLAQAGFTYDSSVFPMQRAHGGNKNSSYTPYVIKTKYGSLAEFPISVKPVSGVPMYFFGGGYLRLFPYAVVRRMGQKVIAEGRPVIFYVHPREIDPYHPRMRMNPLRRFKSYVGLRTMENKLCRLLQDFPVTTFANYLSTSALTEVA